MSWENILKTKKLHYPSVRVAFQRIIEKYAPVKFTMENFINYFLPVYVEVAIEAGYYTSNISTNKFTWRRFKKSISRLLRDVGFVRRRTNLIMLDSFGEEFGRMHQDTNYWEKV